ncbi:MAG: hypothetical protein Q4D60_03760 [Eubacteriales bacterium]|nr:hypothetical protein [Eubacteriales bacterium]
MRKRKMLMTTGLFLLMVLMLTGCEPSKKKVVTSSYYKELKKEKEKLERQNQQLKKEMTKKEEPGVDEERAIDYLDKIARDSLVKLEVGYADNMEGSEFVKEEAAFDMATAIAKRADITKKYTPEEVENRFGPGYEYILYDENNAIYEIFVYGGNYVVFTDLPNNVYYAYNASALGEAFLHYKNGYPDSTLLHRLSDAALIVDKKGGCYENTAASAAAIAINNMEKTKSSRKEARQEWKEESGKKKNYEPKSEYYLFYHHGNTLSLTLYDKYFRLENMDGKKTWYRVNEDGVNALKEIFSQERQWMEQEQKGGETVEEETQEKKHFSEIQEEDGRR